MHQASPLAAARMGHWRKSVENSILGRLWKANGLSLVLCDVRAYLVFRDPEHVSNLRGAEPLFS